MHFLFQTMDSSEQSLAAETSSENDTSLLMRSFGEYSSEDSDIIFESETVNPVCELSNKVMMHRATFNTSYAAAVSFAETINSVPGSKVKIPTSAVQLMRETTKEFNYEHFVFCDQCNILTRVNTKCCICEAITKKRKDNYFIYIPIEQQVKHSLKNHLQEVLDFLKQQRNDGEICDFFDGTIFRSAQTKCSDILLPFTLNLDGAKIFSSSTATLWPIQLIQNYLPPNERFKSKNILLAGVYCGQKKPHIPTIMLPFAQDLDRLQKKRVSLWHNNNLLNFRPTVLYCSCDLPARCEVQSCKSSGYYSCPCCEQKGEAIKNPKTKKSYIRLLSQGVVSQRRTHETSKETGIAIAKGDLVADVKGLKDLSCMIGFKDFNLVDSFVVDYMHGTLIGVFASMLDIWMGKKRLQYEENETFKFKAMNPQQRFELNRRIISLKPPIRINHKPRSILDRSFFTANEYRALLWFYMRFALKGLLEHRLIKHFELLSNATYILSKNRVKLSEVKAAGDMLNRFTDEFQYYYGRNSVTINVHLLRHYSEVVMNCGPLWCHSLFSFETNIGVLKGSFCSTVDVVEQIARNYCIKKSNENVCSKVDHEEEKKTARILREKLAILPAKFDDILVRSGLRKQPSEFYKIGYEMKWKNQVLKSVASYVTKSIDFFVELNNGLVGAIEFFINYGNTEHVVIRKYEKMDESHNHLKQIQRTDECAVFNCKEIRHKLIYLQYNYSSISCAEFITIEPNPYEGN